MNQPLHDPAFRLYQRAEAMRAVMEQEMNPFSRALEALEQLSVRLDAPIAIVGGLAGIHHGVRIITVDIDIVVPQAHSQRVLEEAAQLGFVVKRRSDSGWHLIEYQDPDGAVSIELIPAGENSPRDPEDAPPIPAPQELGVETGLAYASFAGWVAMKLVADREKDRYHVQESLKNASPENISTAVVLLRTMPARYLQEFERLLRATEDEDQSSW